MRQLQPNFSLLSFTGINVLPKMLLNMYGEKSLVLYKLLKQQSVIIACK